MRRYFSAKIYIFVTILSLGLFLLNHVQAADLAQVIMRFDRMKVSTPTTGLVCASPATTDTEAAVEVLFPASFNLSTTLSDWSVATTNIPAGSTPWPGVGTASSVVSQTVTFPSNDLTPGILYCFRWTNSAAITTGSTTANISGKVTTLTGASSIIDTKSYFLRLTNDDRVVVTASVLPDSEDIDFSLSSTPSSTTVLHEDDEVTMTITYRSNLTSNTPLTIEASWDKGTINGGGTQIDIFDYVIGSATTSDEGAVPVVDPINRTITWDIASLSPSATSHTVSFKLAVRSSIPTPNQVSAAVNAVASINGTQLHQEDLTFTIQSAVTPTPTAGPTATSVPGPSATGSPSTPAPTTSVPPVTSVPPNASIDSLSIIEITDTSARIRFHTGSPSTFVLMYGTSPSKLTQKTEGLTPDTLHTVELTGLLPHTQYYFVVKTKDSQGKIYTSDIFTFTTASQKEEFIVSLDTVSISWDQLLLTKPGVENIIIPRGTPVTIHLKMANPGLIRQISARIDHRDVLGITENMSQVPLEETRLIEILPGIFSGDLQPPVTLGNYVITVKIQDIYGGIYNKIVPYNVYVSEPLRVINADSKAVIEDADVVIKRYEESTKVFTPLTKGFSIQFKTDQSGELIVALPSGKYIIDVSAIGFKKRTIELAIYADTQTYPVIELIPDNSLATSVQYISKAFQDLGSYTNSVAKTVYASQKTQTLVLLSAELTLLLVTIGTLSLRLHIGLWGLPVFLAESFMQMIHHKRTYLTITITDIAQHIPLSGVMIYLMDHEYHLIYKRKTNIMGNLEIPVSAIKQHHEPHKLFLYRKGYYAYPVMLDEMTLQSGQVTAHMNSEISELGTRDFWSWFTATCFVVISDILVFATVISAIFITRYHGFTHSLPIIGATITMFLFWVIFIKNFWGVVATTPHVR
ncbi:MAG: hypothetical protein RI947_1117 [Candidatus Parcubacteria bacterium]|jgi:hypothetical protein